MKIVLDRIPKDAKMHEIIDGINRIVDTLNIALSEIDDENLSESIMNNINKEDK